MSDIHNKEEQTTEWVKAIHTKIRQAGLRILVSIEAQWLWVLNGGAIEGLGNKKGCNHLPIVLNTLILLGECPQRSKVSDPPGAGTT